MKAIIITLIFILMSSLNSNAQGGKYTYTFHGSNTAYRKVTPYTGTVDYTFKNGEITKISLHPSWNASDCKNVIVEVPDEKIMEFSGYSAELKKVLLKYREWKEVALKNKVSEYDETQNAYPDKGDDREGNILQRRLQQAATRRHRRGLAACEGMEDGTDRNNSYQRTIRRIYTTC